MDWIMLLLKCCPSNPYYFTVTTQAFKKKGSFFFAVSSYSVLTCYFSRQNVLHCISRAHGQPMDSRGRSNALLLKALQLACEEGRALRYCHSFEPCIIKRFWFFGRFDQLNFEVSEFFEAITRQRAFRKRTAVCHLRTFAEAWEHCRCQVQRGMFSTLLCGTSCMHLNLWFARCCITHCGGNAKTT